MSCRTISTLAAVACTLLLLAGCPTSEPPQEGNGSSGTAGPTEPPGPSPAVERPTKTAGGVEPAKNDLLLLSYPNDPDTVNGITANDNVSNAFMRHVYESLGTPDYKDPDTMLPSLAESWEFDDQTLTYVFHLRKGVKWHPMRLPGGTMLPETEFTARDVKFSFDCVLNPNIECAHIRSYYEDPHPKDPSYPYKIKVTVIDDYTVKVQWSEPYLLADEFTMAGFAIIPRHVYSVDENGEPISFDFSSREFAEGFNNHWANTRMCGTGPMMFESWDRNNRLVLVRNPDYWGPPFYFSKIIYRCIPNENTSTNLALQNELDWAGIAEKDRFMQLADHPNVKSGKVKLADYKYPGYRYVGYNLRRPLFKDKEFRRALAYAVPVQQIIDEVFEGLAVRVTGPFLPGSSACDPSIEPIPYDLGEARRILDAAGWKDTDQDGVRDKTIDNVKVRASFDLMIYSDAPAYRTTAEIIKDNFRRIGVEVQISPAQWALMLQKLRKWDYDAAMLGWGTSWSKGDPFQIWHGSQADVQDSSNHVGYRNDEVDKLIEELRVTLDEDRQQELYHQIHRLIFEDQPYTFLFSEKATAAVDARIQNVEFYRLRPCIDQTEWYSTTPRTLGN